MNLASKLSARWVRIYQQPIDKLACLQVDLINMANSINPVKYEDFVTRRWLIIMSRAALTALEKRSKEYADLDKAFYFSKAMYYGDKCCNGVGYKKSTQNFKLHEFTIISNLCRDIKNDNYKVGDTYSFVINERGKTRNIDAPHIKDRLVHKILSNEIIEPLYTPHLIYDNGRILNKSIRIDVINLVKGKEMCYNRNVSEYLINLCKMLT